MPLTLPILDPHPVRPAFAQGPRNLAAVKLLRLSVTDRCNLRCLYCMPDDGVGFHDTSDVLTARELITVARAARSIGVEHFKITGGEPTVRRDLLEIIRGLAALEPTDLSLTTNAMLLDRLAQPLRDAGLHRLTISLDSLRAERFDQITRGGSAAMGGLSRVLSGIEAVERAGFDQLKLNTVVMAGVNDDEVVDFARITLNKPWTVRFIEYMPLGESTLIPEAESRTLDNAIVRARIEAALGPMTAVERKTEVGVGPANVFRLHGGRGKLGFISAMSRPFCETCNRLRLTATGELRSCLFDGGEVSVLPVLRGKGDGGARESQSSSDVTRQLVNLMQQCVALKPDVHSSRGNRAMSQLGG